MKKNYIIGIFVILIILSAGVTFYFKSYDREKNNSDENFSVEEKNNSNENFIIEEKKDSNENINNEKDNFVESFIDEQFYNKLNINDINIKEMYNKTRIKAELTQIPDYYLNEKFNNDSIITLTLENGVSYTERKYYEPDYNDYVIRYVFNLNDFDQKAKQIWGENVKYSLENYKGVGNCEMYSYNKEQKELVWNSSTGCGLEEEVKSELDFAYETSDKLVLIEKSLYIKYLEDDYGKPGIYNNLKDRLLLYNVNNEDLYSFVNNTNLFQQFDKFVTYYSFTFNKTQDGNYVLADFKRLN